MRQAASRVKRLGPAVRVRRWRDVGATLFLAEAKDRIALVERDDDTARLAAALLASRGVTALVVGAPNAEARERLAAMCTEVVTIEPVLPPGVPSVADDDDERAAAWSALIATFSPDG